MVELQLLLPYLGNPFLTANKLQAKTSCWKHSMCLNIFVLKQRGKWRQYAISRSTLRIIPDSYTARGVLVSPQRFPQSAAWLKEGGSVGTFWVTRISCYYGWGPLSHLCGMRFHINPRILLLHSSGIFFFKYKAIGLRSALISRMKSFYEIILLVNSILICLLTKQVHFPLNIKMTSLFLIMQLVGENLILSLQM